MNIDIYEKECSKTRNLSQEELSHKLKICINREERTALVFAFNTLPARQQRQCPNCSKKITLFSMFTSIFWSTKTLLAYWECHFCCKNCALSFIRYMELLKQSNGKYITWKEKEEIKNAKKQ